MGSARKNKPQNGQLIKPKRSFFNKIIIAIILYGLPVSIIANVYILINAFFSNVLFIVVALYCVWFAWDYRSPFTGSQKWKQIASYISKKGFFRDSMNYFPIRIHHSKPQRTLLKNQRKPMLFAQHPHGVLPFSPIVMSLDAEKRLAPKTATIKFHFCIPIWRELALFCGFVDVGKHSIKAILKHPTHPNSVLICSGGARESLEAFRKDATVVILRRSFFEFALAMQVDLVPVWGEDELQSYLPLYEDSPSGAAESWHQSKRWIAFQAAFKKLTGMFLPLFKPSGGFLPASRPIDVFVGEPVTTADKTVNSLTEAFSKELARLHKLSGHRLPLLIKHL